jgi:anti-anti-sigma regulatory factor
MFAAPQPVGTYRSDERRREGSVVDALGVERLAFGDHACWAFDHDHERLDGTARLVVDGVQARQKVLWLTEAVDTETLTVDVALGPGQLQVRLAADVYLPGGEFQPDAAIDELSRQIALADDEGWDGLRLVSDMAWAARAAPGTDRLLRYETQLNRLFVDGRGLALCMYDRRLFGAAELRRIATAHTKSATSRHQSQWTVPVRVRRTSEPIGAEVVGEADMSNRDAMAAMLAAVTEDLNADGQPIVLDLTGLRFADTAAAALLIRAGLTAPAGARLVGCRPAIARLLALLGADRVPRLSVEPANDARAKPAEARP